MNDMKICLLEHLRHVARYHCNDIANTPLSSSLITYSLNGNLQWEGHDVKVIEGFLEDRNYDDITEELQSFDADILGVHLIYLWDDHALLKAFLKKIRQESDMKIYFYGYYGTFAYGDLLTAFPQIDGIILGEPELAFCALAKGKDIDDIPGFAFLRADGSMGKTPRKLCLELDTLAHPIRSNAFLRMLETNIEGSRGCYNHCTFCYINNYYGKRCFWRGHSVDYIMEEVDALYNNHGKRRFYFTDPNFFGPGKRGKARGMELAERLKAYHIKFGIEARVNDIEEKSLFALVDAGLDEILIGMESGSQKCLDRLNKHTTVAQNENALKLLRSAGISPNIGFIMFEPTSDLCDIRTNFEFLKRNELLEKLEITANLLYHNQILLQGADCYRELKDLPVPAPYHVELPYENRAVGQLAYVMREITNTLFTAMEPLWRQNIYDTQENFADYRKLNDLYVSFFEKFLEDLEWGAFYSEEDLEAIVKAKNNEISVLARDVLAETLPKA